MTCVVIVRTPDSIVVGADSAETGPSGLTEVCKIAQVGGVFFTATGGVKWNGTEFNAITIAKNACEKTKGKIADKAKAFENLVHVPLQKSLQDASRRAPDYFKRLYDLEYCLEVVFFGVENNVSVTNWVKFRIKKASNLPLDVESKIFACPGNACLGEREKERSQIALGDSDQFQAYLINNRSYFYTEDPAKLVKKLVQIEIDHANEQAKQNGGFPNVAGPINILRVTSKKAEWVEANSKTCPKIVKYW